MPLGNLTDCEKELVRCARDGEFFFFDLWAFREGLSDNDRDEARNVDGEVIATLLRGDLCLRGDSPLRPHPRGLRAAGIGLPDGLDIAHMPLISPLWLRECEIARIDADSLRIGGGLTVTSCTIAESVDLIEASIGGSLIMTGTKLGQPSAPHGLCADGLTVKGGVFLNTASDGRRFEADGKHAVRLRGATIDGTLTMQGARLGEPKADRGLSADGLVIKGGVFLDTASDGTRFEAEGRDAVRLLGATIDGNLEMRGARLGGPKADSGLSADGLVIKGNVFLDTASDGTRFEAEGRDAVRLLGATIDGNLAMRGARLGGPKADSGLSADRLTVNGSVFLNAASDGTCFDADGKNAVRLLGATIEGQLSLTGAVLRTGVQSGEWLSCRKLKVADTLFLGSNRYEGVGGTVSFSAAKIGVLADQADGWPNTDNTLVLDGLIYEQLYDCNIDFRLRWLGQQHDSHLGCERVDDRPRDLRPQPFEQCARVLREMGHPRDAKRVLIDKQKRLRRKWWREVLDDPWWTLADPKDYGVDPWGWRYVVPGRWHKWRVAKLSPFLRWSWFQTKRFTTNYGFSSTRPLIWFGGIFLAGILVYGQAHHAGVMVPAHPVVLLTADYIADRKLPKDYPAFSDIYYSLDVSLPLVELFQEPYWEPAGEAAPEHSWWQRGWFVRLFQIAQVLSGWVFISLFVAGLANAIRRDD